MMTQIILGCAATGGDTIQRRAIKRVENGVLIVMGHSRVHLERKRCVIVPPVGIGRRSPGNRMRNHGKEPDNAR